MKQKKHTPNNLRGLMNVGPAVYKDLQLLRITTLEQLAESDPDELYMRLEAITGEHQDPCVWDVLAAIIHAAQTGNQLKWWHFTPIRKQKFKSMPLCKHTTR